MRQLDLFATPRPEWSPPPWSSTFRISRRNVIREAFEDFDFDWVFRCRYQRRT